MLNYLHILSSRKSFTTQKKKKKNNVNVIIAWLQGFYINHGLKIN
jgi:hypothetical protein